MTIAINTQMAVLPQYHLVSLNTLLNYTHLQLEIKLILFPNQLHTIIFYI